MRTYVSIESQRMRRLLGTFVAIAIACSGPALARAQNDDEKATAEEEALYSCGKAKGQVSVSFKPEVELKDLITWAMGFTCRNFVMSSAIAGRNQKVTIIAPKKMSPTQAWRDEGERDGDRYSEDCRPREERSEAGGGLAFGRHG